MPLWHVTSVAHRSSFFKYASSLISRTMEYFSIVAIFGIMIIVTGVFVRVGLNTIIMSHTIYGDDIQEMANILSAGNCGRVGLCFFEHGGRCRSGDVLC